MLVGVDTVLAQAGSEINLLNISKMGFLSIYLSKIKFKT